MSIRNISRILGCALLMTWALLIASVNVPSAAAQPCPDVEVVFARGTTEPPGVGGVGQAFVDSLSSQVRGRSVAAYGVNYPATNDYLRSASEGADDASAHVQSVAANCPRTKLVLGGYSQGAAVINLASSALPPPAADHVAAVALFGTPSSGVASMLAGGPLPVLNPLYGQKTVDLCVPDDPICSSGMNTTAHVQYVESGMPSQAAVFVANRL
jgi:cutinase